MFNQDPDHNAIQKLKELLRTETDFHLDPESCAWGMWFAVAEWLDMNHHDTPVDWGYNPSPLGHDTDCHEFQLIADFMDAEEGRPEDLIAFGNLLERYVQCHRNHRDREFRQRYYAENPTAPHIEPETPIASL